MNKYYFTTLIFFIFFKINAQSTTNTCSYTTSLDISSIGTYTSGSWGDVDRVKIANFSDISGNSIDPSYYYSEGTVDFELIFIKESFWWGDKEIGRAPIHIINIRPDIYFTNGGLHTGNGFNCAGQEFTINTYPYNATLTHTIPTSSTVTNFNSYIVNTPNTTQGTFTLSLEAIENGCTFNTESFVTILPKPIITFPSIQSGQILDTETSPIPLNATSTDGVLTYNGAGVNGTDFTPSLAGFGTKTITAFSETQYGCKDTAIQTVEITHNIINPYPPRLIAPTSGIITASNLYANQLYPTNGNGNITQDYSELHVCDGQVIDLTIPAYNDNGGLDSVRYVYDNNGVFDTIGVFDVLNPSTTYTIPKTGGARIDYISYQYLNNQGFWGQIGTSQVFVTSVNNNPPTSSISCSNEFEIEMFEELQTYLNLPFSYPYGLGQLNNGNDYLYNYSTFNTNIRDLNNNLLTIQGAGQQYRYYNIGSQKSKQIIRTVTTTVPYKTSHYYDLRYAVENPQTCKFIDTITIVTPPQPNFNYSGDTLILGGTTVQVENTSQYEDWTTFDFFNGKGEQIGDTILDTLYVGNGSIKITAYDNFGCSTDSINHNFVTVTDNPNLGFIDSTSAGIIYPVRNGDFTFSGNTDFDASEMHVCDGQTITVSIDTNKLFFSTGIDSVKYMYYQNGIYDTIGRFGINDIATYQIPTTNNKRVDSLITQLITVTGSKGYPNFTPVYVSYPLQREPSSRILNCNETLLINSTEYIGNSSSDFNGLQNWVLNGNSANASTFETQFKDVNGLLLPSIGSFTRTLSNGNKVDTVFRKEITRLPYRGAGFNYYNLIENPQTCELNDTIIIVRPPIASFTFSGQNVLTFGTAVKHISTSQFADSVEWDFHDGSHLYNGDTIWHVMYEIGDHDVTVRASDIYGCEDVYTEYGYIEVMDWTSIEENGNLSVKTLGNPFINRIELNLSLTSNEDVEIIITDMNGKVIFNKIKTLAIGNNRVSINGSALASGTYLLGVKGQKSNTLLTSKLIKR